jgi:predicted GIY-YIG superfamily endonuclease
MRPPIRTVYLIRSISRPERHYIGITSNLAQRLDVHNSGGSRHTMTDRPWRLVSLVEFADEAQALRFEKYLKSGSGRAFAKRHLL